METIIKNLGDPSWWFTGLFFAAIACAIPGLLRKLQGKMRGLVRYRKFRNVKRVKILRWDLLEIHLLISRASANYIVFVGLCFVFFFLLVLTPLSKSIFLMLLASIPIYVFEVLWLIPESLARQSIKSRNKISNFRRISHPSNNSFKANPLRGSAYFGRQGELR